MICTWNVAQSAAQTVQLVALYVWGAGIAICTMSVKTRVQSNKYIYWLNNTSWWQWWLQQTPTKQERREHHDPQVPLALEVDASQKGLGIAWVQNNRPIAFGSKTLSFLVVTDHKPLVTICTKPLHAAPPQLQRMLIKTQGYNYQIVCRPETLMVRADTLSQLPNPENHGDI